MWTVLAICCIVMNVFLLPVRAAVRTAVPAVSAAAGHHGQAARSAGGRAEPVVHRKPGLRSHGQVADASIVSGRSMDGVECPAVWKDLENKFLLCQMF